MHFGTEEQRLRSQADLNEVSHSAAVAFSCTARVGQT